MISIYVSSQNSFHPPTHVLHTSMLNCSLLPNIYIFSCLHVFKEFFLLRIPFVQPWQTPAHPLKFSSRSLVFLCRCNAPILLPNTTTVYSGCLMNACLSSCVTLRDAYNMRLSFPLYKKTT